MSDKDSPVKFDMCELQSRLPIIYMLKTVDVIWDNTKQIV